MNRTYDGNFSLAELQNTLQVQEELGFVETQSIRKEEWQDGDRKVPVNVITFQDSASDDELPKLMLTTGSPPAGVRVLFTTDIWVGGQSAAVTAYRGQS